MFRRGYTRISRSTYIFSWHFHKSFVCCCFLSIIRRYGTTGTGMSLNKIELLLRNLWNLFSKVFKLEKNNTKNYILVFSEKNKDKGINVNFYLRTSSKLEPASDLLSSFLWLKNTIFFWWKVRCRRRSTWNTFPRNVDESWN